MADMNERSQAISAIAVGMIIFAIFFLGGACLFANKTMNMYKAAYEQTVEEKEEIIDTVESRVTKIYCESNGMRFGLVLPEQVTFHGLDPKTLYTDTQKICKHLTTPKMFNF